FLHESYIFRKAAGLPNPIQEVTSGITTTADLALFFRKIKPCERAERCPPVKTIIRQHSVLVRQVTSLDTKAHLDSPHPPRCFLKSLFHGRDLRAPTKRVGRSALQRFRPIGSCHGGARRFLWFAQRRTAAPANSYFNMALLRTDEQHQAPIS